MSRCQGEGEPRLRRHEEWGKGLQGKGQHDHASRDQWRMLHQEEHLAVRP